MKELVETNLAAEAMTTLISEATPEATREEATTTGGFKERLKVTPSLRATTTADLEVTLLRASSSLARCLPS
jgi:hypothetical protein